MRNSLFKKLIFSLLALSLSGFSFIGYSSFLLNESIQSEATLVEDETADKNVFIKGKEGIYYTNLETAIDDANQMIDEGSANATIVVNPGSVVRLNESRTLKSGVDLLLPTSLDNGTITKNSDGTYPEQYMYGTSQTDSNQPTKEPYTNYDEYGQFSSSFSDCDKNSVEKYLVSTLLITSNVNLTISSNSNVVVFGQTGRPSSGINGSCTGFYSQIVMLNNSLITINSGGVLDCRGFVKEGYRNNPIENNEEKNVNNGSMIINNGNLISPFVIYDYGGGNSTVAVYAYSRECPFSSYDLPQIHTQVMTINGVYKARADLYTGYTNLDGLAEVYPQHNTCLIDFIGSTKTSIFNIGSSPKKALLKYSPDEYYLDENFNVWYGLTKNIFSVGRKADKGGLTNLWFSGNISTNFLSLDLSIFGKNISITTNGIYFPIPFNFQITFDDSELIISNDIKFMPGSIVIFNNSKIKINSRIAIYKGDFIDSGGIVYPACDGALFELSNSELEIENGAFGGFVATKGNSTIKTFGIQNEIETTDSSGGSLSIGNLDAGEKAILGSFLLLGQLTDNVLNALSKATGNSVTQQKTILTFEIYLNESGNLSTVISNYVYNSLENNDYFTLASKVVSLNLSVVKNGSWNRNVVSVDVYIYEDSNKNNLLKGPLTYSEDGFWGGENNVTISNIIGTAYVVLIKNSNSDKDLQLTIASVTTGTSPLGNGDINNDGFGFYLDNDSYNITVSD